MLSPPHPRAPARMNLASAEPLSTTNARKRALVTGASSGIGLEVARGLCARGYETILAVRDRARGEAASGDIAASTRGPAPEVLLVDFSEPASIRAFADEAAKRYPSLDVLVNNAGICSSSSALLTTANRRRLSG